MYTINIDAGGTMTDALVVGSDGAHAFKVDSTPHDLTVAMLELIERAAAHFGFADRRRFLDAVGIIRWSSTVATNVLAERRGPKLGLLVEAGQEERLYGAGRSAALGAIVQRDNVVGLAPDALDPVGILAAVRRLLEQGVRRICVSFAGAFEDPAAERRCKDVINAQYPDHYLGSVPVLLGSHMAHSPDDQTRTHAALINAYVHPVLAASLYKAEDRLKIDQGWAGTFLVGHTNGGLARIGKTKALDTIESGPVFGTQAGAYFAQCYGLDALLCLDVGGTTAKLSVVRHGRPVVERAGALFGIPLEVPLQMLQSRALGGGSIARVQDGRVQLGPDSMGAAPGPACYGLGGSQATLTDCLLLLGYLDAGGFLDGRRPLDVARARTAVARDLAEPLGAGVEQAAAAGCAAAVDVLLELIGDTARAAGVQAESTALFAYGGNGPLLGALLAERLAPPAIYVSFVLGPVFSAFGTAISEVVHVYEQGVGANGAARIGHALGRLRDRARRDLEAEGFAPGQARYRAEFDPADGAAAVTLPLDGAPLPAAAGAGVVRLRAQYPVPAYRPSAAPAGAPVTPRPGRRLYLDGEFTEIDDYDCTRLRAGAAVDGPALLTGGHMTCLVPRGWRITVDAFGNGVMRRRA
jgi:N-methylhydantoinase A/oxoprolinase/acetone carboxylase beta subunit